MYLILFSFCVDRMRSVLNEKNIFCLERWHIFSIIMEISPFKSNPKYGPDIVKWGKLALVLKCTSKNDLFLHKTYVLGTS